MDDLPQPPRTRGLGLLAEHLQSFDPDRPTARERLDAVLGLQLARMLLFALAPGARHRRAA